MELNLKGVKDGRKETLRDVVDFMAERDYECFLMGWASGEWLLIPISQRWWSDDYAPVYGWVNAFCGVAHDSALRKLLLFVNGDSIARATQLWADLASA